MRLFLIFHRLFPSQTCVSNFLSLYTYISSEGASFRSKGEAVAFGCIVEIVTSDQIARRIIHRISQGAYASPPHGGKKFTSRGNADKRIRRRCRGLGDIYTGCLPPLIEGQQSDKLGHPLMNVPCSR